MIFLPNRDITESVDIFSNVLCNIFNSFIVSYSSKCLAEISPFYRKGNKRVKLENSILPNLSKNSMSNFVKSMWIWHMVQYITMPSSNAWKLEKKLLTKAKLAELSWPINSIGLSQPWSSYDKTECVLIYVTCLKAYP